MSDTWSEDDSNDRPQDLPPAVSSPIKSYSSRTVSSPSLSESEEGDNYVIASLNNTNMHVDLLEPPHPCESGRKPRALKGTRNTEHRDAPQVL